MAKQVAFCVQQKREKTTHPRRHGQFQAITLSRIKRAIQLSKLLLDVRTMLR
jgi:hypothetical protein